MHGLLGGATQRERKLKDLKSFSTLMDGITKGFFLGVALTKGLFNNSSLT